MSLKSRLGYIGFSDEYPREFGRAIGREFFETLFSSPSSQAKDAATTQAGLQNNEIQQEQGYVNTSEQNLRNAIQGQGPNPYFAGAEQLKPTPVNPGNTANFFTPPPAGASAPAGPPPQTSNLFAAPPQGSPRMAQPVARTVAAS